MDAYLRSIGFIRAKYKNYMAEIENEMIHNPDKRIIFGMENAQTRVEYYKMYSDNIGLVLRGYMDENERISVDSLEAIAVSDNNLQVDKFIVEYADNQPVIVFEDIDTGNELVFGLQNQIDLYKDERRFVKYGRSVGFDKDKGLVKREINLAALSLYGNVILPIFKEPDEGQKEWDEEQQLYKSIVLRFREGDDDAQELLNLYQEHTSAVIRERLKEEDFLSVVEGYFLPMQDNETDYSILGEITDIHTERNAKSGEKILKLDINVTGTNIQLFINSRDLTGFPVAGMRFMGTCRLQGRVIIR